MTTNAECPWSLSATGFSWTPDVVRAEATGTEIMASVIDEGIVATLEIEIGQIWRSFPDPSTEEVDALRERITSAGGTISIVGASIDDWETPTQRRDDDSRLAFLLPQLRAAQRLGADGVRLPLGQAGTPLLQRLQPVLEELDLVLLEEIQGSQLPTAQPYAAALDAVAALDDPRIRLLVDTSMLMPSLPPSYLQRLRAAGVPEDVLTPLNTDWLSPDCLSNARALLQSGGVPGNIMALFMNLLVRFGRAHASDLRDLLPMVGGIHLKFWDLDDSEDRISRPIRELASELDRSGYAGLVCSEWGGHDWIDDLTPAEATRGHLALARPALAAGASH